MAVWKKVNGKAGRTSEGKAATTCDDPGCSSDIANDCDDPITVEISGAPSQCNLNGTYDYYKGAGEYWESPDDVDGERIECIGGSPDIWQGEYADQADTEICGSCYPLVSWTMPVDSNGCPEAGTYTGTIVDTCCSCTGTVTVVVS